MTNRDGFSPLVLTSTLRTEKTTTPDVIACGNARAHS